MVKETKNLLWAVAITILIYLYLVYKAPPEQTGLAQLSQTQIVPSTEVPTEPKIIKAYNETVVGTKTIKLLDVNKDGAIIVSVDGRLAIIKNSGAVDSLEITVIDTFYSENSSDRAATLIISEA